ncbi:mothers against decapentaplegic homolog 6 [Microplitis demolitor]|uniref:mothers against decapentaplegic homolog 6 n=1 Tax=Microplitis demolitor TaxID=69319 RepID=UPI0004CCF3CC|nr:mothers against decapentaplegic homolog 6 [Microplitis demolitor]XP_008557577.1 mothers against decapentaplegic homolog 6 [Microplitis demolitor]XP_008557578.1 mothers against decapentaplegic homolog 6 [Microplitis demolitor]XP_008557579.1 mothers against decapentaplegic homolog 6 [Microplitis demolitor]XP_008557580.1 mothers against decapentaplegic homolog 6 [Microplitis demolitor]
MFMFWSKRTILTKRLLKAQVCREYETECETQENTSQRIARVSNLLAEASACSDAVLGGPAKTVKSLPGHRGSVPVSQPQAKRQTSSSGGGGTGAKIHQVCCGGADSQDESDEDEEDDDKLEDNEDSLNGKIEREARERLNRCKELLKNLKENQLEMLLTAIESCGADLGSCVVVARRPILNSSSQSDINTDQQQQQQPDPYRRRHSKRKSRHYHHPLRLRHSHHQFTRVRSRCRRYELHQGFNKDTEVLDESSSLAGTGCTAANDDERCLAVHSTPDPRTDFLLTSSAHLLSCQIWRWPDICLTTQLKKLPLCHSTKDPSYVCCNPYHWSRLCKPESPPPPYCLIPANRGATKCEASTCAIKTNQEDTRHCGNNTIVPSRLPESLTTDGEERGDGHQRKEWCTLAYWELGGRVGRLYPVESSTISVFDSLHDGDGLCLASLAENHDSVDDAKTTRSKIGLGLLLSQEDDGVWAYNRSSNPIFVNSPTLDDPESRTLLVYRVPPGSCLNIFDRAKNLPSRCTHSSGGNEGANSGGPVDIYSVRISFVKGWGPRYKRQEITSCPCWLEVLLAPCR